MSDLELLECAQSVYDFLTDDIDIRPNLSFRSFNEIPSFKKMNDTLEKFGLNPDLLRLINPFSFDCLCRIKCDVNIFCNSSAIFFSSALN